MKPETNIIQAAPIFEADQVARFGKPYLQSLYDRCVALSYREAALFGYELDPITLSPVIDTFNPRRISFKEMKEIKKIQADLAEELEEVLKNSHGPITVEVWENLQKTEEARIEEAKRNLESGATNE